MRSDTQDNLGGVLSYHSNEARLQFRNSTYGAHLHIGGWSTSNDNDISRIRNSNANLHLDSGANGHLYLNNYSSGDVYANGANKVWHAGNDGSGSGLDADKLDGIQASRLLRSDTSDSFSGQLTFTGTNDQKILLQGTSNPYIRFQEGTSNKAYIQWHSNGNLYFVNQESAEHLRIGSGILMV